MPSPPTVEITRLTLAVPRATAPALARFYAPWGTVRTPRSTVAELTIGAATIAFVESDGHPFHHFALRVPGGRFDAARAWLAERAPLCASPEADRDAVTFDFREIGALAAYVLDPVGDIVELIAFADLDASDSDAAFAPAELAGIAEIGLVVGDHAAALRGLADHGLHAWLGDDLQFVGVRGETLILAPPGRGWLPHARPAQPWPATVDVCVDGAPTTIDVRDGVLTV